MASAAAQRYYQQFSPAEQQNILNSWGGDASMMDEWFNNAVAAGAVSQSGAPGTAAQAQQYAANVGQSEDFLRFQDPDLQRWAPYWDPDSGRYRSSRGAEGLFDKPTECPPGMVPGGPNETDPCVGGGGGGGGGYGGGGGGFNASGFGVSGSYGGPTTGFGGAPAFQYTPFSPPLPGDVTLDPSYQFRVDEGREALEASASARGVLNTGGTLKDILDYGQEAASQEYQDIFNRALATWGAQYQGQKDAFAPSYGSWQTVYGGDLQRWLTQYEGDIRRELMREGNIYDLLSAPPPYYG